MKSRNFNVAVIFTIMLGLMMFGGAMVYRDPFFHYHKPIRNDYNMNGAYARYYNDGFIKHFDYDAIILGTSMCNNFRTSQLQELFGVDKAIKVNASGAYFNETNDYLQEVFTYNPDIKLIVRSLDCEYLGRGKDELSIYAKEAYYLRDKNVFNDVNYVLNKNVWLESCITKEVDWDEYLSWRSVSTGREIVCADGVAYSEIIPEQRKMDDERYTKTLENIEENIVWIMKEHPNTEFYLFLTPYSIYAWGDLLYGGQLEMHIEEQRIAIEQILQCDNAHLFSFCDDFDITCNVDNYFDKKHYAYWINDEMLNRMHLGLNQITLNNYDEYLDKITAFYLAYPYSDLCRE